MAPDLNSAAFRPVASGLFDAVLGREPRQTAGSYCCIGCGEEITFDSLAATCKCSQECYLGSPTSLDGAEIH